MMKSANTETKEPNHIAQQTILEELPEEIRTLCTSGKSVMELAHLVKNIIQMVSGSAEIMKLGLERKQYDRVLRSWDIFEPNLARLQKFILDLIKYTKRYPIQRTECDFNQTIINAIKACGHFLKNNTVKVELHEDKAIPICQLDTQKIEQMTANLIIHAFDNLNDHAGKITIQTHHIPENHQIQLTVSDDGPLLSKEMIVQIQEPFERTRNMTGTGFDIPLAQWCVEQHNGYMEIAADQTQGNQVSVYLPVE